MTDNDDFRGVYALIGLCLSRCQPEAPMQLTAKAREWKALKAVIDAALSAQSTGSGGVAAEPVAGWKLVPETPTPAMVAATWREPVVRIESHNARNKRIYAAMLAAAPSPDQGGEAR